MVVQRSLWGPQKSKNKPVTALFLRPLAVKDPVVGFVLMPIPKWDESGTIGTDEALIEVLLSS